MSWIFFAFAAPLCFAVVNKIDEHLINKNPEIGALVISSGLFGFISSGVLLVVGLVSQEAFFLGVKTISLLIFSGVLELIWIIFYLKAFDVENEKNDASAVTPWFQFVGFFTYVFGWLLLGESLSGNQLIGLGLTLIGGSIISLNFGEKITVRWRAVENMLWAASIIALGSVLFKFAAVNEPSFVVSAFWLNIGLGITALFLYNLKKSYRDQFRNTIKNTAKIKNIFTLYVVNEVLNTAGVLFVSFASLLTEVSKVYAIGAFQSVFVFLIGLSISLRDKEGVPNKRTLLQNLIVLTLMIIGAFLIEK